MEKIMKKLTFKYVYNYFQEQNCELLEKKYVNNRTKMKYQCKCGNKSEITFRDFKTGRRCRKCSGSEKFTYKYVYNYFQEQNCELLEKKYVNNRTKMKYKCKCKNNSKITFGHFKDGERCKKCSGKEKLTYEYVKQYFEDNNCKLLEEKYINNNTKMKYKCKCKNKSEITFRHFKDGKRCKKCSGSEKFTYKYVYNYFKEQNCKLLEKKYYNTDKPMKYKCNCKNISKISFYSFKRGSRCRECGTKKVSGKNHPNYNPNITEEEREIGRKYPEYREWTQNTYKKDNYICQKCFQKGEKLNAHHIINYASNKELRLDKNNGITFCKACHKEFHKKYGVKNNNRKQLNEFLNFTYS
jgi:hypothetical protein